MKKIIKKKVYDTNTATLIGQYENETLYQKKTGEFFLWIGGSNPGEAIKPILYDEAREWAEKHMTYADEQKLFGEPEEDDGKVQLKVYVSKIAYSKVKQGAAQTGKSLSQYIEQLISSSSCLK